MYYYFPYQGPVSRKYMITQNTGKLCFSKSQLNHSIFVTGTFTRDGGISVDLALGTPSRTQIALIFFWQNCSEKHLTTGICH